MRERQIERVVRGIHSYIREGQYIMSVPLFVLSWTILYLLFIENGRIHARTKKNRTCCMLAIDIVVCQIPCTRKHAIKCKYPEQTLALVVRLIYNLNVYASLLNDILMNIFRNDWHEFVCSIVGYAFSCYSSTQCACRIDNISPMDIFSSLSYSRYKLY